MPGGKYLLLTGALLGVLALFYTGSTHFGFAEHERFDRNLELFQQLDNTLNEDVLKARSYLLDNYDGFPVQISELKRTLKEMNNVPAFIPAGGGVMIRRKVKELSSLVNEKEQLLESFKSQNAVLTNSLRYLPVISAELVQKASAEKEAHDLTNPLNHLVQQVLLYSIRSSDEGAAEIRNSLAQIKKEWPPGGGGQHAGLASAFAHVNSIVTRKPKVEALTREIVSLATGSCWDELRGLFDHEIAVSLQTADRYRLLLQIVCALLFFGIGCTIRALHNANQHLESRVGERTNALQAEVAERRNAETLLKNSEQRFRQLAAKIQDVFWLTSPGMKEILYVSPAYEKIWARTIESLHQQPLDRFEAIIEEDRSRVLEAFAKLSESGTMVSTEYRIRKPDGELCWILDHGFPIYDEQGRLYRVGGIAQDITKRKRMEAKLLEAGKLETVGRLAGGIAHDFNTILTTIIGHAALIGQSASRGGPQFQSADQIGKSAARAAQLTQQLLAFSRKQMLQSEILDLNATVAGAELILRRLLGDSIDVRVAINARQPWAKADAGQIQQMLAQLALNAQDAMPGGGRLTLETGDITLDENYASTRADAAAGEYVMIAISDTGTGISEELKPRLFEPFFTTKPQGEGTGLGLSMCHGIARQIGGHISVYSELGLGTTFKVYLPRSKRKEEEQQAPAASLPETASSRGTETILLVEDDAALRDLAGIVLEKQGYHVLTAANGLAAAEIAERNPAEIDLLLTDVVMPQMGGKELADRLQSLHPRMKVLFTSAYTEDAIVHHGILDPGADFLRKPYTPAALSRQARAALDRQGLASS